MKNRILPILIVVGFMTLTITSFQNFNFSSSSILPETQDFKLTIESNNELLGWPATSASDGAIGTVYSSKPFYNDPTMTSWTNQNPKPYLVGRLSKRMPISRVIFGARSETLTSFPVLYDIYLLDGLPNGTNWVHVGRYGNQPDQLGVVAIDLGKVYYAGAIQIVPRILGHDGTGYNYFQLGELRVLGPAIYRFTGLANASSAFDGNDATYKEFYAGTSATNTNNISATFSLTQSMAAKLYLKASMSGTQSIGFPAKYNVKLVDYQFLTVNLGDFTTQPDKEGNLYIDLNGNRFVRSVTITPINYGPGATPGNYSFRIAEANLLGPFNYIMNRAETNEGSSANTNAAIDSNFAQGDQRITIFSSTNFPTAVNNTNPPFVFYAWTPNLEPVSSITLYGRMTGSGAGAKTYGFPASYQIRIFTADNINTVINNIYLDQPTTDGMVTINLGKTYLTYGFIIFPIDLNKANTGDYKVQFADVRSIANALDGEFLGTKSIYKSFALGNLDFLLNGYARMTLQPDGNLLVTNDADGNNILWASNTGGRVCNGTCSFEFSNGYLRLKQNGVVYWTTQTFNSAPAAEMRFSRFPPYIQTINSAGAALWSSN